MSRQGAGGTRRTNLDRTIGALIFVGLFAFYLAIQRGEFVSVDGRIMAGVARNLWLHLDVHRTVTSFGATRQPGWSIFGIGMSLVMAPFWALQLDRDPGQAFWLTLSCPLLTASSGVVVYRIATGIGLRSVASAFASLAFGLLTLAPMYSAELFSEPGVTLAILVAVLGMLRWQQGRSWGPWLVGFGIAWAILFRYESTVVVAPMVVGVLLFVPGAVLRARWRAWLPALVVPIGSALVWTGYYNDLRFGSPFHSGPNGHLFTTPLLDGLQRQLLSTGKGFFWYSPILLAAIPGCVLLWRRHRGITAVALGLSLARLLFFSGYYNPDGSVSWGPRYLVPVCALLALPLAATFDRISVMTRARRYASSAAVSLLALVSAAVVVASVWVPYEYAWARVNDIPGWQTVPGAKLQVIKEARLDREFNDWYSSPILLGLRSLDGPHLAGPFPLRWWRGGPSLPGVVALAIAAAAVVGTIALGRRRDRQRHGGRSHTSAPRAPPIPSPLEPIVAVAITQFSASQTEPMS